MSNISNRHNINLFESGKSASLSGQRLAKVGYKKTDKCPNPLPSICVSVPPIEISEDSAVRLIPYMQAYLSDVQDKIIRNLYETSEGTLSSVSDEEISVDACIAYLESESTGGRLTKEYLETWFTQNLEDNLSVVIAEKLGYDLSTPEQIAIVSGHVKTYKDLISSLSGGKTVLAYDQINGVLRALEVCSVDDEISTKLNNRLIGMKKKIETDRAVFAL
jgi:hypothetical protein